MDYLEILFYAFVVLSFKFIFTRKSQSNEQ
jgi:ABC-type transport system involved in cytochrome c biogenesis permease subunit